MLTEESLEQLADLLYDTPERHSAWTSEEERELVATCRALFAHVRELEAALQEKREALAKCECRNRRRVDTQTDANGAPIHAWVCCGNCPPCLARKELAKEKS